MSNKEKLSECLGWLAVALAQYVGECGLPYGFGVDQVGGKEMRIQMVDCERSFAVARHFGTDYILSLEDPIECLRMELVDMHNGLRGEETE